MRAFFFILILIIISLSVGAWYSMQSLPYWADNERSNTQATIEGLSANIREKGIRQFLSNKAHGILKGVVNFDELEFNAILLASLQGDKNGRKLLSVSDSIRAFLKEDRLHITAIINLKKLQRVEPKSRKAIEKFNRLFPFLNKSRMAVTVYATPIARKKQLAIKDDFYIKVGAIPISNESLKALGVNVERVNFTELPIKYLSIKSVKLAPNLITLDVSPRL